MKTFKFEITETLQKTINIEAENEIDAYKLINDMYKNGDIILDTDDFIDKEINIVY